MPTYEWTRRFDAEWRRLRPEQQRAFLAAVARFVDGLRKGQLDPRLRVHRVQARQGTWELSCNAAIVHSTVDLGRNLGLEVVAERVETQAAYDELARLGCDYAQGFLLARPLPAPELAGARAGARAGAGAQG